MLRENHQPFKNMHFDRLLMAPSEIAQFRSKFKKSVLPLLSLIFSLIALISSSCGNRRPPLPPAARRGTSVGSRRQAALDYLSAVQQGNKIRLKATLPASLKPIKQVSIYRLSESPSVPLFLSEEDFAARSTLIGTIQPLSTSPDQTAYYDDALSNAAAQTRLRYALRFTFSDSRRSAFSNFLIVEPNFRVSLPPILNTVQAEQTLIRLEWEKPRGNIDPATPLNAAGYNVYRISDNNLAQADPKNLSNNLKPLNQTIVTETSFADSTFEFNKNYQYFVRAVTNTEANSLIESLDSNFLAITPRDIFPPAPPQSLTIAAAPNRISLFFAANSEPDLAGYLIYRSPDGTAPLDQWMSVTNPPLTTNTFQDAAVESGQKYYYYLRAIDKTGNISQPSEIIAETVP